MSQLNKAYIAILVTALSVLALSPSPSLAKTIRFGPAKIPPECTTHGAYPIPNTADGPAWEIVMNFETGVPAGCAILFKKGASAPTQYVPIHTCSTVGSVAFSAGRATFTGGYITCNVNLQQLVFDNIGESLASPTAYDKLFMSGNGRLFPSAASTAADGNPIIFYWPNNPSGSVQGLSVPQTTVHPTQPNAHIVAFVSNAWLPASADFPIGMMGSYSAFYVPKQVDYWLDAGVYGSSILPLSSHALAGAAVPFWTDGGVFIAGQGPNGSVLYGEFDEMFVDPPGKGGGGTR